MVAKFQFIVLLLQCSFVRPKDDHTHQAICMHYGPTWLPQTSVYLTCLLIKHKIFFQDQIHKMSHLWWQPPAFHKAILLPPGWQSTCFTLEKHHWDQYDLKRFLQHSVVLKQQRYCFNFSWPWRMFFPKHKSTLSLPVHWIYCKPMQ